MYKRIRYKLTITIPLSRWPCMVVSQLTLDLGRPHQIYSKYIMQKIYLFLFTNLGQWRLRSHVTFVQLTELRNWVKRVDMTAMNSNYNELQIYISVYSSPNYHKFCFECLIFLLLIMFWLSDNYVQLNKAKPGVGSTNDRRPEGSGWKTAERGGQVHRG